jgi:hypothetical protein
MTAIVASSMSFEELSTKEGIIPIRDLREVLRLVRRAQHAISGD